MQAWILASLVAALVADAPTSPPAADGKNTKSAVDGFTIYPTLRLSLRGEARVHAGDDADPDADDWHVTESVRLGVVAGYKALTAVAQLHDVRDWGLGRASNDGLTGVYQSYIEIGGQASDRVSGWIRIGRQQVAWGSRRHFHYSPWNMVGRALDAVRGHLDVGRLSVEAMYTLMSRPQTFDVTDDDGNTTQIQTKGDHSAYLDVGFDFHEAAQLHGGVLVQNTGPDPGKPTRDQAFIMPGARLTGEIIEGLDYQAEGWVQSGHDGDRRHLAWMAAGGGEYTSRVKAKPGLRLLYEVSSGEGCIGDPTNGEPCGAAVSRDFDQIDGARHYYRGHMDLMAGRNLRDLAVTPFVIPSSELRIELGYHFFQLSNAAGRWYRINGESVWGNGWTPGNTRHTLGHELDLEMTYKPWKYLSIRPGYLVFIKGPAARQLLPPAPIHFVYLWFLAEF